MAEIKHTPVRHDHQAFLGKAGVRKGFKEAYDDLAMKYQGMDQLLQASARAGFTQDAVVVNIGGTKSTISSQHL